MKASPRRVKHWGLARGCRSLLRPSALIAAFRAADSRGVPGIPPRMHLPLTDTPPAARSYGDAEAFAIGYGDPWSRAASGRTAGRN